MSPSPPSLPADPDRLGLDLTVACSRFSRTAALLARDSPGSATWRLLATLDAAGPLRPSELAHRERTSRPAATDALRRLGEQGLVRRRADPDDARASLIELTDAGRTHLTAWREQVAVGLSPALADLPAADRADLARAVDLLDHLTRITEGLLTPR